MFDDIDLPISSILLGSVNLIWGETKQHALSLWGPDADMSEEAGSRPKRIAFLCFTIFPVVMYLMASD